MTKQRFAKFYLTTICALAVIGGEHMMWNTNPGAAIALHFAFGFTGSIMWAVFVLAEGSNAD